MISSKAECSGLHPRTRSALDTDATMRAGSPRLLSPTETSMRLPDILSAASTSSRTDVPIPDPMFTGPREEPLAVSSTARTNARATSRTCT